MFFSLVRRLTSIAARLACDDGGSDLIEYALLTALVGILGILSFTNLSGPMSNNYTGWDSSVRSLWIPPAPAASGS
jgi:Flp pilus assembly pilin Flp